MIYLGKLVDLAGTTESKFVSTSGELDWADLLALLDDHVRDGLADAVLDPAVKVAVNGQVLADKALLAARLGDEIALLPPVSGG